MLRHLEFRGTDMLASLTGSLCLGSSKTLGVQLGMFSEVFWMSSCSDRRQL